MLNNLICVNIVKGGSGTFFETDFSEYTTGQPPGDWSETWLNTTLYSFEVVANAWGNSIGGKALNIVQNGISNYCVKWDTPGNFVDGEVLMLLQTDAISMAHYDYIILRGQQPGDEYTGLGYFANLANDVGNQRFGIGRFINSNSTRDVYTAFTHTVSDWYWVRFQVIGNNLKGKIWLYGNIEPSWMLETTDTDYENAGWVGFVQGRPDSAIDARIDYIAVDTAGNNIPLPSTWVSIFDDTKLEVFMGSATWIGSSWQQTDMSQGDYFALRVKTGETWEVGLRPTKVRLTLSPTTLPTDGYRVQGYDGGGQIWNVNAYVSGTELDITLTADFMYLTVWSLDYSQTNTVNLTNIEWYY